MTEIAKVIDQERKTQNGGIVTLNLQRNFLQQLQGLGKSINTIKNYRTDLQCFNRFLEEYQKDLNLNDFTYEKVQEYGTYIEKKYNSNNSRRRRIQALRLFFDFLVKKKLYHVNPVKKLPTNPKFLDKPRPTSLPHIQKLWSHLKKQAAPRKDSRILEETVAARNQIIFLLIYCSGLKVSDLEKLQERDINNSTHPPRVTVNPRKREPYTIPIHPVFHSLCSRYQKLLAQAKTYSGVDFPELFFSANPFKILRGGLSSRGVELTFEGFRNNLDIQVTPKSLRQAGIFTWLKKNHPDALIKEWLGVAPSYSLKLYQEYLPLHGYNNDFLLYEEGYGEGRNNLH